MSRLDELARKPGRTGSARERVTGDVASPWYAEHRSRYLLAVDIVQGLVLDIAAGAGFGVGVLESSAAVIGVDRDVDALQGAMSDAPSRMLLGADGLHLPFAAGVFDTVVSFETLEHISDSTAFVAELRRVLRDTGLLVLSTPNALHTKPIDGTPRNPFHVHEYEPGELVQLLAESFSDVKVSGQRPSDSYGYSPYWQRSELAPTGMRARARILVWKVLARIPAQIRDPFWRAFSHREFYPTDTDFVFDGDDCTTGHVLVAICRP